MNRQPKKRFFRGLLAGLCVIGMTGVASSSQALASAGMLDPTFGAQGRAVAALDFGDPRFWYSVKVQAALTPDGRILVAGDGLVLQYLSSGQLDRSFAEDGLMRIESAEGEPIELNGLVVDSQGRIVAAGTSDSGRAAILRFGPNGAPDPTFGDGDGVVVTDFGLPPPLNTSTKHGSLRVSGVAVDGTGRIVVSGSTLRGQFYSSEFGGCVGRLTAQGIVDPTFGSGGVIAYDRSSLDSADGLTLDDSGAPLFFGTDPGYRGTSGLGATVRQLDVNGSPDSAFGQEGQVAVNEYPRRIALDRSGRIVVMERHNLLRLLPSGAPDTSFGEGGTTAAFLRGAWSGLDGLAVTRNGGVLVTGHGVHYFDERKREPRRRLVLARLGPRGVLERHFGNAGIVKTRFGRPSNTVGRQVLLDGNGHALVAGMVRNRRLSTGEGLALYRYDLGR